MKLVCECGWETQLGQHRDLTSEIRFTPIWFTGPAELICANCRLTLIRYGSAEPSARDVMAVGEPPKVKP